MKSARADLALAGVCAIWGVTFLLVKQALGDISPMLFIGLRFGLAAAALGLVYRKKLTRAGLVPGLITGLFLFAGYGFQTVGLQTTTASKSAFLTSLSIPLVPLAAALVYRHIPGRFELLGVLVASAGMALLTAPGSFAGIGRGDWLSLCCAVCFAGQILAVSHFRGRGNFETLAFVQMLTASLLGFGLVRFVETPVLQWGPRAVGAILITGLLASALAFAVQAWAQQYTSPVRAAVIYALEPVFAWVTSWLAIGETLEGRGIWGAVLILFGILIVEGKRKVGTQG